VQDTPGTFESQADALSAIAAILSKTVPHPDGFRIAWTDILPADALIERVDTGVTLPDGAAAAMFRRYRYVIRKDDLKLFDSGLDLLKTLGAMGLLFKVDQPMAMTAAVLGVGIDAAKLLGRVRSKAAILDERSFFVICILKANEPMRIDKLLDLLRAYDLTWTEEELKNVLAGLKAYPSKDGTALPLVISLNGDREWRTTEF
jgi:hypothetical protein